MIGTSLWECTASNVGRDHAPAVVHVTQGFVTDLTAYPEGIVTWLSARQVHSLNSASYPPLWLEELLLLSQHIYLLVVM